VNARGHDAGTGSRQRALPIEPAPVWIPGAPPTAGPRPRWPTSTETWASSSTSSPTSAAGSPPRSAKCGARVA